MDVEWSPSDRIPSSLFCLFVVCAKCLWFRPFVCFLFVFPGALNVCLGFRPLFAVFSLVHNMSVQGSNLCLLFVFPGALNVEYFVCFCSMVTKCLGLSLFHVCVPSSTKFVVFKSFVCLLFMCPGALNVQGSFLLFVCLMFIIPGALNVQISSLLFVSCLCFLVH